MVPALLHTDPPSPTVRYEVPGDPAERPVRHDHRLCVLVGSAVPDLSVTIHRIATSPPITAQAAPPRPERARPEVPPHTGRPRGPPLLT